MESFRDFWESLTSQWRTDILHALGKPYVRDKREPSSFAELEPVKRLITRQESLAPLQFFPNLKALMMAGREGGEWEPISQCTGLERLEVGKSDIRDLALLEPLQALRTLSMPHTGAGTLEPLAALPNLEVLDLSHTIYEDWAPLLRCEALRELTVCWCDPNHLPVVAELAKLRLLNVQNIPLPSLGFLKKLDCLECLLLGMKGRPDTADGDLTPLRSLPRLKMLGCSQQTYDTIKTWFPGQDITFLVEGRLALPENPK